MIALLTHIVIALSSLVYTTYLWFYPSRGKFNVAYTLVGLTVASGTYLVVTTHVSILHTCVTGLVYLAAVSAGILAASRKLAHVKLEV